MAGYEVNRNKIDMKTAEAIMKLRAAFGEVKKISAWLTTIPNPGSGWETDPLVTDFEYTTDEAYIIRYVFESLENIRTSNASMLAVADKLTGLE